MALIGTISGSNGTSTTAISGSLIVANRPNATFPSLPSGITFYVSGTKTSNGSDQPSVLFTGDTFLSGALGTDTYFQMKPVGSLPIPTNTTASYIYTSGSTNDMYFTQYLPGTSYTNTTRLRWLESTLQTGLLYGGLLSTANGSTTFSLTSGSGIIVNFNASTGRDPYPTIVSVQWPSYVSQSLQYSGTAPISYISIDSSGQIHQKNSPYTNGDFSNYIQLGRVLHQSGSVTNGAITVPQVGYGFAQYTNDFVRAFGPLKLSGNVLGTSGSNLSISKTAGDAWSIGRNYSTDPNNPNYVISDPATTVSKVYREYVSGSTLVLDTGIANAGYTTIDPTKRIDSTTGNLTTTNTAKFTIQRVYWFPRSINKAFHVYYGSTEYQSLNDAQAGISTEDFLEDTYTRSEAIFLGYILVLGNASDLTDTNKARFIQAGFARGIGGGSGGSGGGSTSPGGSDTYVQFNDGGTTFGGATGLTYNKTTTVTTATTLKATTGLSGSLTKLTDGTSYLIAGSNVTITTGSNGAVTIASTGGGGSSPTYIDSLLSGKMYATGTLGLVGNSGATAAPSDTVLYVSGQVGSLGGTVNSAVFAGDVVVSGVMKSTAWLSPAGVSDYVTYFDAKRFVVSNGDGSPGLFPTDIAQYFSGTAGSKGTTTRGVTVISGDAVVSGTLYNALGTAYTAGTSTPPSYFTSATPGTIYSTGSVAFVGDLAATKPSDFGSDVVFFVSGNTFLGNSPSVTRGALFKGDLLLSGAVIGKSNLGIGKNALIAQSQLIAIIDPNDSAAQVSASDVFAYVSGAIGSKGTGTRGTTILGGDVVTSGSQHVGTTLNVTGSTYMSDSATMTKSQNAGTTFSISNTNAGTATQANFNATTNGGTFYFGAGSTAGTFSGGGFIYTDANVPLTLWTNNVKRLTFSGSGDTYFNVPTFRVGATAPATVGADVNFSVSGSSGAKDSSTRGVAVFGGDVVVSGSIYGGAPFGTSTTLTLRSGKVQVTANALSQGQSGGNDVSFFVSGSSGSRNGPSPGTSLFGGDVTISGSLLSNDLITTTGNIIGAPGSGANVMSLLSSGNIIARLDVDNNAVGHKFEVQDYLSNSMFRVGEDGNAFLSGTLSVSGSIISTGTVSFAGGQGLLYSASSAGSDVFFYVSGTARSGHNPPTFVGRRSLFGGDVVTSGTLQLLGAGNILTIGSDTLLFVSGSPGSKGTSFSRGASVFAGDLHVSGVTHLGTVSENATLTQSLTSVQTFDMSLGSVFHTKALTGNIAANFVNVPTFEGRVVSSNLIVSQSASAFIVSGVQVAGVGQTILWANGVTPTGNAGKHDVFGFSLIRSGSAWTVLGQMSTYG